MLPLGAVRDANIDWRLKKVQIPAATYIQGQSGLNMAATMNNGMPIYATITSNIGLGAMRLEATTDTLTHLWWAYDIDVHHPVYVRHLWTTNHNAADQQAVFRTLYSTVTSGMPFATPSQALTVAIASSSKANPAGAAAQWSPWGAVAPIATGSHANELWPESVTSVVWRHNVNAVNAISFSSQFVYLVATEYAYTPRMTFGGGSRREARAMNDDVTNMAAGASQDFKR